MASPWSLAYDGPGIFYVSEERENVDHQDNNVRDAHRPERSRFVGAATKAIEHSTALPIESNPQRVYLPVLHVSAKVSIKAMIAQTVITQSFQHVGDTPIEHASYTFPLYDGSVVHGFKCFIGKDRVIEGVVEPKKEAKAQFEKAVARQKVAALLEEHTSEIFETHIGSIPAKGTVRVEVSYISELKVDLLSKDIVFILPTSIAPRYGTAPEDYSKSNNNIEEQGLEVNVDVSLPTTIVSMASRSHPINVSIGYTAPTSLQDTTAAIDSCKGNAMLSNRSTQLDRDFILLISPKESISNTRAFMETHLEYNNHSAVMVAISPQDFARSGNFMDSSKKEVIFVIDCSGSMRGKVNDLRTAMKVAIRSLPEETAFNLCLFGSSSQLLWNKSKPAIQENSDEAFTRSANLTANMGGTEIHSALNQAVISRTSTLDTNIIVVTDGQSWDTENILKLVRDSNKEHGVRFFCVGIGNRVSHALVEGIGRQGGGLSDVVTVAEPGRWEARVIRMVKGALTPTSWQVKLHPGPVVAGLENLYSSLRNGSSATPEVRAPFCIQAPFHIPKLHTFSRLSVFLLVNNSSFKYAGSKIQLTAESSNGETIEHVLDLEKLQPAPSIVHYLATHAVIKDLENETSWLHDVQHQAHFQNGNAEFQDLVKQEAESLGTTWSIAGKWTSFIAVEKSRHNSHIRNLVHRYHPDVLPAHGPSKLGKRSGRGSFRKAPAICTGNRWDSKESCPDSIWEAREACTEQHVHAPPDANSQDGYRVGRTTAQGRVVPDRPDDRSMTLSTFEMNAAETPRIIPPRPIPDPNATCNESHYPERPRIMLPRYGSLPDPNATFNERRSPEMPPRSVPDPKRSLSNLQPRPGVGGLALNLGFLLSSDLTVDDLMSAQSSTGYFVFAQASLDTLLGAFDEEAVQEVKTKLETISSEEPTLATILALVYIEMRFKKQLELLELVVKKAKGWLEKTMPGEHEELFRIARGGFSGKR